MAETRTLHPDVINGRFGSPSDDTVFWQIHRVGAADSPPLGHPDADGVVCTRFPLADLSMQLIRERWGNGRYFVRWYSAAGTGTTARSKSPEFELASVATDEPVQGPPTDDFARFQAMQREADSRAKAEMDRVLAMAQALAGQHPQTVAAAPRVESDEVRQLREELAVMRQKEAVRSEVDRVLASQREERERFERRIAELERERERDDDGPAFDAESPIVGQVVNFAVNAAMKNPDMIMGLIGTFMQKLSEAKQAAPTLNPAPAPTPAANVSRETSPPRPAVNVVVPFPGAPKKDAPKPPVVEVVDHPMGKPEPIQHDGAAPSAPSSAS